MIRVAVYTREERAHVQRIFKFEDPVSKFLLDIDKTLTWERGAQIHVHAKSNHAHIADSQRLFIWQGDWEILRFDATVRDDIFIKSVNLEIDLWVEGFRIIRLRNTIPVVLEPSTGKAQGFEQVMPSSAFASYSQKDADEVHGRVRTLQLATNIKVFLDCLDIKPGNEWQEVLKGVLDTTDVMYLFWSRNASSSRWVEWEWRRMLKRKGLVGIQPHPLEPSDIAPPPRELSALQFDSMFDKYIYLKKPDSSSN